MKGAKGLGIDIPVHQLSLLISNCLVNDVSLPSGKSWTLGNYTTVYQLEGINVMTTCSHLAAGTSTPS